MISNIILLGAPGSGKGTQAKKFVENFGYGHLSTGDLLRAEVAKESELGKEVKAVMDSGQLVSDDLVIRLLKSAMSSGEGFVFDGFPRNAKQSAMLEDQVIKGAQYKAVYFKIDLEQLVERLTNRRTCGSCGAIYNLKMSPTKQAGVCDSCGSTDLIHRDDDKEETIRNRMSVFAENNSGVLNYYKERGSLVEVDADQAPDVIWKCLVEALG